MKQVLRLFARMNLFENEKIHILIKAYQIVLLFIRVVSFHMRMFNYYY